MFSRTITSSGPRRLVAAGLSVVMLAVLAVVALTLNTRIANGAAFGECVAITGPTCTFKGHVAFADFSSVSADGCVFTDVSVIAFERLTNPGRVPTTFVDVTVVKFNDCTFALIEDENNTDPATGNRVFNGTLQFGTNLDRAAISGSAAMFDISTGAQLFTSTINVAWQGFGPTSTFITSSHERSPGLVVNRHFKGTSRAAEASGVVTDATASNLTTQPTSNANLENDIGGTVQITHP